MDSNQVFDIFDAVGAKVIGPYFTRDAAMRAIPPSQHSDLKAIPVAEWRAERKVFSDSQEDSAKAFKEAHEKAGTFISWVRGPCMYDGITVRYREVTPIH